MSKLFNLEDKKGISVVIGYVLLITFGIVISVVVFTYLKTFVPSDIASCPDGTSMFLKEYSCSQNQLNITLKNNGRFTLNAFFIHATDDPSQELAVIDLASNFSESNPDGLREGSTIYFHTNIAEEFSPNEEATYVFDLNQVYPKIELIPARFQTIDEKERFVVCSNARIYEEIICN